MSRSSDVRTQRLRLSADLLADAAGARDRTLVDAGGHLGTKYIAFAPLWPSGIDWVVLGPARDLPRRARRQAGGALPAAIGFATRPQDVPASDIFLGSGLMQYMETPLSAMLDALPARPKRIILNKVATREGPTVVTLERIGASRVPYHIRNRETFEAELAALPGYRMRDRGRSRASNG